MQADQGTADVVLAQQKLPLLFQWEIHGTCHHNVVHEFEELLNRYCPPENITTGTFFFANKCYKPIRKLLGVHLKYERMPRVALSRVVAPPPPPRLQGL